MGHQDGLVVEEGLDDASVRFNFRFWFLEDSPHEGWTVLIADKTVTAKIESLSVDLCRQARNSHCLASCRLLPVLDLEGAARPTRTTAHFPRGPRSDPQDVPGESQLGCTPHPRRAAQARHRHRGEQRQQIHDLRGRKPPSQTWRTFLENHAQQLVSIDFFTVPTIRFQVLYVFLVLAHDRHRIQHFNVTAHPTAEWTGQQLREAFPFAQLPRYLLRDRDAIFGNDFREQVRDMGTYEVLSAPRSPWQRAYVERVIGSIRRECLDHVIVFRETSLRRTLNSYFDYYHRSRTHLSLGKDSPEPRAIQPPGMGSVVAVPQVGGLHHRYERRAA
jgi:putative transposase